MVLEDRYQPDRPITPIFKKRWSPYSFIEKDLSKEDLMTLFEAIRFAPSSFNEQPWRFFVAKRSQKKDFQKILNCLVPGNQDWAKYASVLMLSFYKENFTKNNKPNRVALYDLGAASAFLTMEATQRGLHVHQMAGIVPEKIIAEFSVPDGFKPATALAIGYTGDNPHLSKEIKQRDQVIKGRKEIGEFVFVGNWDNPIS